MCLWPNLVYLDPESRKWFVTQPAIDSIVALLWNEHPSIVVDSVTTLIFLFATDTQQKICTPTNLAQIRLLSRSDNPRISNVAKLFLADHAPISHEPAAQAN